MQRLPLVVSDWIFKAISPAHFTLNIFVVSSCHQGVICKFNLSPRSKIFPTQPKAATFRKIRILCYYAPCSRSCSSARWFCEFNKLIGISNFSFHHKVYLHLIFLLGAIYSTRLEIYNLCRRRKRRFRFILGAQHAFQSAQATEIDLLWRN